MYVCYKISCADYMSGASVVRVEVRQNFNETHAQQPVYSKFSYSNGEERIMIVISCVCVLCACACGLTCLVWAFVGRPEWAR